MVVVAPCPFYVALIKPLPVFYQHCPPPTHSYSSSTSNFLENPVITFDARHITTVIGYKSDNSLNLTVQGLPFSRKRACLAYRAASSLMTAEPQVVLTLKELTGANTLSGAPQDQQSIVKLQVPYTWSLLAFMAAWFSS